MPHPIDALELRRMADAKLQDGRLPSSPPEVVLAGPGSGSTCALCAQVITSEDVEYECEQSSGQICLHVRCHAIWQLAVSARVSGTSLAHC